MTPRHLVPHRKLTLHSNIDLHQFDDARREFVSHFQATDLFFKGLFCKISLFLVLVHQFQYLFAGISV